ncbi:MAG TPA: deoxyribodipyrimidine photo-lyase [Dongiaceae bacterium]|jgi:deoxyribodipyrimidine photo-lyase|nr:deoxyribodipyrimidine photo-lyase [Dongiaceae bacterium]
MKVSPAIVWFRLDLRLADHPALHAALERGGPVLPVFIWAPEEEAPWVPGGASNWWLHHSLTALQAELAARGSRLILRRGPTVSTLQAVIKETGAGAVYWNRRYEPAVRRRDDVVRKTLQPAGVAFESFPAALLHEPNAIENKSGRPFQVFTPFWKACLNREAPVEPLPAPRHLPPPSNWPASVALEQLELLPKINWTAGMQAAWRPGAAGAAAALEQFLQHHLATYEEDRDRPALPGTSRLAPHLHFGEMTPRQVWHALRRFATAHQIPTAAWREGRFLTEIGWREFAHHLLYHFPHTPEQPLHPEFTRFPWVKDDVALRAWQRGRTGCPLVDAGMRELWTTGWMHNRVRMVVASFLVKNLRISWPAGAQWFWDTLVDADLANNTLGWQWTAGCGADAAPYFRVFNPVTQGEKFDPQGAYIRRWVPELAGLPDEWIHQPWAASPLELAAAKVRLGDTYPHLLVDLAASRKAALAAFQHLKS